MEQEIKVKEKDSSSTWRSVCASFAIFSVVCIVFSNVLGINIIFGDEHNDPEQAARDIQVYSEMSSVAAFSALCSMGVITIISMLDRKQKGLELFDRKRIGTLMMKISMLVFTFALMPAVFIANTASLVVSFILLIAGGALPFFAGGLLWILHTERVSGALTRLWVFSKERVSSSRRSFDLLDLDLEKPDVILMEGPEEHTYLFAKTKYLEKGKEESDDSFDGLPVLRKRTEKSDQSARRCVIS